MVAPQEAAGAELVEGPHQRCRLDAERVGDLVLLAAAPACDEDQRQRRRFRQAVRAHDHVGEPAPRAGRLEQVEAVALEVLGAHDASGAGYRSLANYLLRRNGAAGGRSGGPPLARPGLSPATTPGGR